MSKNLPKTGVGVEFGKEATGRAMDDGIASCRRHFTSSAEARSYGV